MKNKQVNLVLSMAIAAAMLSAPAAAWAETADTTQDAVTEDAADAAEDDASAEENGEDFTIAYDGGELTVTNQTTLKIKEARLEEAKAASEEADSTAADAETADDAEAAEAAEAEAGAEDTEAVDDAAEETTEDTEAAAEAETTEDAAEASDGEKTGMNLILVEEDGTEHTFEGVQVETWTEPTLVNSYEFLYINYKDADGKEQEAAETADERDFDTPVTMYVSSNVHIRKEADQESESLKVAALGEELTVTGAEPGWFKVESGDIKGYVFHSYITEDKEAVDALVQAKQAAEAEAAAQAAAAAAAQAQAEADAAAAAEAESAAQTQEKTEVSRQAYDDCDGSGHGYYEITWSDGSVTYEEY